MAQQQLNRAKVSRAAIDDRRLCAPERVGPKFERVKTDTADPFPDQACVLPGGQATCFAAAPSKQELPWLPSSQPQVIIDRLTGLLG